MHKYVFAIGIAMVAAAFLPGATAHLTNDDGSATSFGEGLTAQPFRWSATDDVDPGSGAIHVGVSGTYTAWAQNQRLDTSAFPVVTPPVADPTGELGDEDGNLVAGQNLFDGGIFAASTLCDAEVIDGDGELDESVVDADRSVGGAQPDGTFDDGGFAAACHTGVDHYGETEWNTWGCSGQAHAEDWALGGGVFIAPTCSYVKPNAGTGGLSSCLTNIVLGDPTEPLVALNEGLGCTSERVNCALDTTCSPGTTQECLNSVESSGDIAFGNGGGQGGVGVDYPVDGIAEAGCDEKHATAAVFVFSHSDDSPTVAEFAGGWIDTTSDGLWGTGE